VDTRAGTTSGPPDFAGFVEARWPALVRYAYALTGDRGHAEDIVQQALERCWRRWRTIRADGCEAYVRTAVVRLVISRHRVRRVAETPLEGTDRPTGSDPEESVALREVLWRALAGLPPRMRAVVVLRYVEDQTETEVARTLGCSVGSVKSQASRGVARLREIPELHGLFDLVPGRGPADGESER
jgi:RNA polymerase sigma-70 factor (sigma-E family)